MDAHAAGRARAAGGAIANGAATDGSIDAAVAQAHVVGDVDIVAENADGAVAEDAVEAGGVSAAEGEDAVFARVHPRWKANLIVVAGGTVVGGAGVVIVPAAVKIFVVAA